MCSACGFQGVFSFARWAGLEEAEDELGAMFDTTCPACGEEESVFVAAEELRRMVRVGGRGEMDGDSGAE
jgi:hypothetical protein